MFRWKKYLFTAMSHQKKVWSKRSDERSISRPQCRTRRKDGKNLQMNEVFQCRIKSEKIFIAPNSTWEERNQWLWTKLFVCHIILTHTACTLDQVLRDFCPFHFLKQSDNSPDITLEGAKKADWQEFSFFFVNFLMSIWWYAQFLWWSFEYDKKNFFHSVLQRSSIIVSTYQDGGVCHYYFVKATQ